MNEGRRKVKFSLTKFTKKGRPFRFNGYGEIDDENLYTKDKVYEDCIRFCHKTLNSSNEFKGSFSEFEEIEFENQKHQRVELEIENCYQLWYRVLT